MSTKRWAALEPRAVAFILSFAMWAVGCLERREEAESRVSLCSSCHGSPNREGTAIARAAPPLDVNGNTDPTAPGVGAHLSHVEPGATHGAVLCVQCHRMPADTLTPGHIDSPLPAEVVFGALATRGDRQPVYDPATHTCSGVYCHGSALVTWTAPRSSAEACGSCHGLPPPAPHPASADCMVCHGAIIDSNLVFIAPLRHIDGAITAADNCGQCHGTPDSPAPPRSTAGETEITSVSVGAHQAHLRGSVWARRVKCVECHVVPVADSDPGHIDGTLGAEVVFSGTAVVGGAGPAWDLATATCDRTWCHGPSAPAASQSPAWTTSLGATVNCTSCHGMPPDVPHPPSADCSACHHNVDASNNFTAPDTHIDGIVTMALSAPGQ